MPETRNRLGLSRSIPEEIKRRVRQRDSFGCIICGSAIIEYEHFEPEFKDAAEHSVDGICLLCPLHHAEKTRGWLSVSLLKKALAENQARPRRFSKAHFRFEGHPTIHFGPMTFIEPKVILRHDDVDLIYFSEPEHDGAPYRLNARFYGEAESLIFSIEDNEWKASSLNWDVEVSRNLLTIRTSKGMIALSIRMHSSQVLMIERVSMEYGGLSLQADRRRWSAKAEFRGSIISVPGYTNVGCEAAMVASSEGGTLTFGCGCRGGWFGDAGSNSTAQIAGA